MDDPGPALDIILKLVLLFVLIFFNAFFAMSEIAIISLNDTKMQKLAEEGNKKAKQIVKLTENPNRFLSTIQIGVTLAGFLASASASQNFADLLVNALKHTAIVNVIPESVINGISVVLITIITSYFSLVLGELAPKRIAMQVPEKVSFKVVGILLFIAKITKPFVKVLSVSTNGVVRLFGFDPNADEENVTEEEIRLMVENGEESGAIQSGEKELIENIFEFDDITAEEIMVHRTDMTVLWLEDTGEEILKTIRESGLSRFPMCGEDMDDIIGILSTRDYLLNAQQAEPRPVQELLRPAHFVPESVKADVLFRDMQQKKVHMAIVVDEYGGTSGLVTMEDLLEQLVGEIYDEFDSEEEQEISKVGENLWRIAGSAELEDVAEALDLPLPEEDDDEYETLGGLVFSRLSVIPQDGSHPEVEALGMHIKVQEIRNHRVEWTLVSRLPQPGPEEE